MPEIDIGGTFRGADHIPIVNITKDLTGKGDVFLYNERMMPEQPNLFVLDLNPVSIKYSRVADIDKRMVRGGVHYQFKRVRKEAGQIDIDTGSLGIDYLRRLGSWIETWMRKNVDGRVGPILLGDVRDRMYLDIIISQLPMLGRARTMETMGDKRHHWTLAFEIVEDYQTRVDLSQLTDQKSIPVPRGSNVLYVVLEGDTLAKVAQKLYKLQSHGVAMIRSISSNHLPSSDTAKLHAGTTLIAPDVPQEVYDKYAGRPPDSLLTDLSDWSHEIWGSLQNIFDTGNNN